MDRALRSKRTNTGSDDQHIYALIHAKGYTLPREMMSVRFVHLLDNKRKDLMIIYSEDLPAGGPPREAQDGLVSRAKSAIFVQALHAGLSQASGRHKSPALYD